MSTWLCCLGQGKLCLFWLVKIQRLVSIGCKILQTRTQSVASSRVGGQGSCVPGRHILGWPGEATASAARKLQAESVSQGSHQCHTCFRAPHQLLLSCRDPGSKGIRLFTKPLHAWLFASPRRRELWTSSWPLGSMGNGDGCGQDRPSHHSPRAVTPNHSLSLSSFWTHPIFRSLCGAVF